MDPVNVPVKFEVRSFTRSWDYNSGYFKTLGSPWNSKTALCSIVSIVHRAIKQRQNTSIADIIGIVDSKTDIDPSLYHAQHVEWGTTRLMFSNKANTKS